MSRIFPEAIINGFDTCRWCVQHCPDEEKYEMLVTCIRIKNEFSLMGEKINLLLGKASSEYFNNIIRLFENLTDSMLTEPNFKRVIDKNEHSENMWKLPGCSQIFLVAQSLEQINIKEID